MRVCLWILLARLKIDANKKTRISNFAPMCTMYSGALCVRACCYYFCSSVCHHQFTYHFIHRMSCIGLFRNDCVHSLALTVSPPSCIGFYCWSILLFMARITYIWWKRKKLLHIHSERERPRAIEKEKERESESDLFLKITTRERREHTHTTTAIC